jgi:hypothetical protein
MSALTPRVKTWLGTVSQPPEQISQIALALVDQCYTSVEIIVDEDAETLLALPKMEALKPGAKMAFKKKLLELKVMLLLLYFVCRLINEVHVPFHMSSLRELDQTFGQYI